MYKSDLKTVVGTELVCNPGTASIFIKLALGGTVAQRLALSPHSKKVLGSSPTGPFCVEFACSPRVCVGSLQVLRLPPKTCRSGELETLN
ncbi:hypothetical protein LDENG_00207150 [Lucifuga dentata]|nr:hypothetical protein LDENG_00207150 [Lucifuga dentata]